MPVNKAPSQKTKLERGPGAPPGNLNALKHGFYSRIFRNADLEQLHQFDEQDVAQEIELLRLIIRRTVERSEEVESFDAQLRFLSVLGQSTAQLIRLLKVQRAYLDRLRSKEDEGSLEELYLQICNDTRRFFSSLRPQGKPVQAPSAAQPDKSEVQQDDSSQPSLFGDEDDQSQDASDDKFWPSFISSS